MEESGLLLISEGRIYDILPPCPSSAASVLPASLRRPAVYFPVVQSPTHVWEGREEAWKMS